VVEPPNNAPSGTPVDPAMLFTALADTLYQGADTTEVCAAICMAATLLVPDCDHASVLMRRNDDFVTVAASDRIARHVDFLERATGEGPCLDAIEDEAAQVEPDLANSRSDGVPDLGQQPQSRGAEPIQRHSRSIRHGCN
jgi:hypothetical protein